LCAGYLATRRHHDEPALAALIIEIALTVKPPSASAGLRRQPAVEAPDLPATRQR
jgi:hypothetical protein